MRGGVVTGVLVAVAVAVAAFLGARRVLLVFVLMAVFLSLNHDLVPATLIGVCAVPFRLWRALFKIYLLEV